MKTALTTIQILIRTAWTVLLILGLAFWAGLSPTLIVIHMVVGIAMSLCMWGLAFLAIRARVSTGLIVLCLVWSLVLPALGLTQAQIFPAWSAHWVIKVIHLLVGVVALAQIEMLGGRIKEGLEDAGRAHKRPVRKVHVNS
jgi:hypothetical protein